MGFTEEGYKTIKEEITKDPASLGYAAKSVSDVAALINDPTKVLVSKNSKVPIEKVYGYAIIAGFWVGIVKASMDPASKCYDSALKAKALMELYSNTGTPIDVDRKEFVAVMDDFIADGIMTEENKAVIQGMATYTYQSRAQQIGWGHLSAEDIEYALSL